MTNMYTVLADVADLRVCTRVISMLENLGIRNLHELMKYSWLEIFKTKGFGRGSMKVLEDWLATQGLKLKDSPIRNKRGDKHLLELYEPRCAT